MLIEKKYQGNLPTNKIVNTESESQYDTYSCEYINNIVPAVLTGTIEPTSDLGKDGDIYIMTE